VVRLSESAQIVAAVLTGASALITAFTSAFVRVLGALDEHATVQWMLRTTGESPRPGAQGGMAKNLDGSHDYVSPREVA
jgi:hypothetical protein